MADTNPSLNVEAEIKSLTSEYPEIVKAIGDAHYARGRADAERTLHVEAHRERRAAASATSAPAPAGGAKLSRGECEAVALAEWQKMASHERSLYHSQDVFVAARIREIRAQRQ